MTIHKITTLNIMIHECDYLDFNPYEYFYSMQGDCFLNHNEEYILYKMDLCIGNQFKKIAATWMDRQHTSHTLMTAQDYLLNLYFQYENKKIHIMMKPNKNIRISLNASFCGHECELYTYIGNLIRNVHKKFQITSTEKFTILLINSIVANSSITNTHQGFLKASTVFPIISKPDFHGLTNRRKGAIKMHIHDNKKHGTIIVNKSTFQLLGFVSIPEYYRTLEKLDLITLKA